MSRRFHLIALILVLCGAAWWSLTDHGSAPSASSGAGEKAEQPPALSQEEIQTQFEVVQREKEASLPHLNTEETELQNRERAAMKTAEAREQQQVIRQAAWTRLLSTNWTVYQNLRAQAFSSKSGTAPCTICDGRGKVDFCVLCDGHGKCQTCGGSGHLPNGDLCPNCLGNGKCYLCGGTGKMVCPFCDDGMVYSKLPPPPNQLPIFCQIPTVIAAVLDKDKNPKDKDTSRLSPEQLSRTPGPASYEEPILTPLVDHTTLMAGIGFLLAVVFVFLRVIKLLNDQVRNGALLSQEAADRALRDKLSVEEPSMVAFFSALRLGLEPSDDNSPEGIALSQKEFGPPESEEEQARRLQEFFDSAPYQVSIIRSQFSKISLAAEKERARLFRVFLGEIEVLKQKAGMSPLRPIWLMTCGLEGLIHQLAGTSSANASVMRTISGAVDLLEDLCVRGFDPTLATRTPVELLAVDDNAVCLAAVSMALKKAFRQPDLASDGLSALASVEKRHYDVIFLDVEMPGMNGFDLCTEIHKTNLNITTPVVFVTSHSDFDSRAKSALVGGQELIAKPYLSFEITVKALTLALHGRLVADTAAQSALKEEAQDCVVA